MALAILVQAILLAVIVATFAWLVTKNGGVFVGPVVLCLMVAGAVASKEAKPSRRDRRARAVRATDEPRIADIARRLSLVGGVTAPAVDVVRSRLPLSWTTAPVLGGRAKLHVTTGLMDEVSARELEAVVAHELGHIINRDAALMTVLASPPILLLGGLRALARDGVSGTVFTVLMGAVLVPVAAVLSVSGRIVSRHRELAADRAAAVLAGSPARVAAALTTVAGELHGLPHTDLRAVAARDPLHLLPVREATGIRRLWATHPPLAGRVARLERMERALQHA